MENNQCYYLSLIFNEPIEVDREMRPDCTSGYIDKRRHYSFHASVMPRVGEEIVFDRSWSPDEPVRLRVDSVVYHLRLVEGEDAHLSDAYLYCSIVPMQSAYPLPAQHPE